MKTGIVIAIVTLGLAGCASIPAPLSGDYPDFYPDQTTERSLGATVRWGGVVISAEPESDRTCLEILARPLDRGLRPLSGDHNRGRFLACRRGFQDPAVFREGREVTLVGRLEELAPGMIGDYEYHYPRMQADVIYLWPPRPDVIVYDHYPGWWYYGPYHGPYYYGPYRSHWHVGGSIRIR